MRSGFTPSIVLGALLLARSAAGEAADTNASPLLSAMAAEVSRAHDAFRARAPSLYYLGVGITDTETLSIGASFGALTRDNHDRVRLLDVDARCGTYARDNTHPLPGYSADYRDEHVEMPLDDDPAAIRMALWRALDGEYRRSAERFAQVQALDITKAALRDKSDDFSRTQVETFVEPARRIVADPGTWREKVKRYTRTLRQAPDIYRASATLHAVSATRDFVNTEGTRLQFSRVGYYLSLKVDTRSDDGLDLPLYKSFFSWNPDGLPDDDVVLSAVTNLAALSLQLRKAPLVDPYSGPALLEGEAAAVFMHEVLGHRLEGHRQKDEKQSQTFKAMVGRPVMSDFISIIFDPTVRSHRGLPMSGCYPFDEEGVRARRVVNVDKGILKDFLMSRTPIEDFPLSNGHGRAQPGMSVVSRQSNLIIDPAITIPAGELRARLKEECRRHNKPYGLVFTKVEGGFTMTGRTTPNAFNVSPLLVYRVYVDDRPDELVRGVDIIGTPLTVLTKIIAAGDDAHVFNGTCGAESGGVPVGAVSPSLLLGEIEVQKKEISRASPPVLPAPVDEKRGGR